MAYFLTLHIEKSFHFYEHHHKMADCMVVRRTLIFTQAYYPFMKQWNQPDTLWQSHMLHLQHLGLQSSSVKQQTIQETTTTKKKPTLYDQLLKFPRLSDGDQ